MAMGGAMILAATVRIHAVTPIDERIERLEARITLLEIMVENRERKIETLEDELAEKDTLIQAMRAEEDSSSSADSPTQPLVADDEETDAAESPPVTYRGVEVTPDWVDKLWALYGGQYIVHDGAIFDVGRLQLAGMTGQNVRVSSGSLEIALEFPSYISIERRVENAAANSEGGVVCAYKLRDSDEEYHIFVVGDFEMGDEIAGPLVLLYRHPIANALGSTDELMVCQVAAPITGERFIEALNAGMVVRRYAYRKRRGRGGYPGRRYIDSTEITAEDRLRVRR